ncbi:MAG: GGDEF domain-containing protein [Hylemonella sp.]|uniref:GGDEF domain-containing protein n=1 Tax=Hylemonella sp. TaxID=2066020 RepID=UPI0022CC2C8A|nr:GGDEF domain-containing protein [Hylemonella sp.]MCZ8252795.1 GGDEF domain-containing protein [Hylemonella sp.]
MALHTPTLLVVMLLMAAALGVSMALMVRGDRRDPMRHWAAGMGMIVLTMALFGLRGQIDNWWSVVLGNTLLVACFAWFGEGLCVFQQRAPRRLLLWSPVALMGLALGLMQLVPAPEPLRPAMATGAVTLEVLLLMQLMLSRRRQTSGRGQYFVLAGLLLILLALLARLLALASGTTQLGNLMESRPEHTAVLLAGVLTLLLVGLGLVMMTKERTDALNRTLALQDELTGLANRRAVQRLLDQQLALHGRRQAALTLLLIDVDHFKRINDTHGHLSGDVALREIGACLIERLRGQDVVGRWGGEEFIALLPDTGIGGARKLAEQLRRAVEQLQAVSLAGKQMPLTVSIGLHTRVPADEATREEVIAAADGALYQAKQNGRNRIEEA